MTHLIGACVACALAGCLEPEVVMCGDRLCPAGFTCGNGALDPGEACDDGNFDPGDGCSADCRSDETCGNELIDDAVGEGCDDGNDVDGDGCSTDCQPEFCGNGFVDPGEACDDGAFDGGDGCSANCQSDETCGNGQLDWALGEECDCGDGSVPGCTGPNSDDDGATCWTDCTLHRCGDGHREGAELCDGAPAAGTCLDLGFDAGPLGCSASCTAGFDACRTIGWRTLGAVGGLRQVWAASIDDVFALGNATILRWDGATWTVMPHPDVGELLAIWGSSASDVHAVGNGGTALHFDGASWTDVNTGLDGDLFTVSGGAGHAITASTTGEIATWDGDSWTHVYTATDPINGVWAASATEAWAATSTGVVLHGVDGVWTPTPLPTQGFLGVWGSSATDVWLAAYEGLFRYDGESYAVFPIAGWPAAISGSGQDDVYVAVTDAVLRWDGSGWRELEVGTSVRSISALPEAVLIVTDSVLVNEGDAWGYDAAPDLSLDGIGGTSATDVHAVGDGGIALHFDGVAWRTVSSGTVSQLHAVWEDTAVGDNGTVVEWDGAAWRPVATDTTFALYGVWESWAVGTISILRDDGASWSLVTPNPATQTLWDVWGVADDDVYAVGSGGLVLHWTGSAWTTIDAGTTAELHAVWAGAADDVWVAGRDGTVRHWNGATWQGRHLPSTTEHVHALRGVSSNEVYAQASPSGTIWRWSGGSWTIDASPGTGVGGLWVTGASVYATGPGALARRSGTWSDVINVIETGASSLGGISAAGPDDVWKADVFDLVHFDGFVWTVVDPGPMANKHDVWAAGPDDVVVVGTGVLHWDGASWTQIDTALKRAVSGSGPGDIWVSGPAGSMLHYDGSAWTTVPTGSLGELYDVWAASPTAVFTLELGADFLHWDGATWTRHEMPAGGAAWAIHGFAADDVYAVGQSGYVAHWDGAAWSRVDAGTYATLYAIGGTGGGDVYLVGANDTVVHFDGARWAPVRAETGTDVVDVDVANGRVFLYGGDTSVTILDRKQPW